MTDSREEATPRAAAAEAPSRRRINPSAIEGREVIESLLAGDDEVFARVVRAHHSSMVRLALAYVSSREIAEEVAQEAWTALVEGLGRFEGRSSLKTWLFGILLNRARTRGARESRLVSLSTFESEDTGRCELLEGASARGVRGPARSPWVWGNSSRSHSPEDQVLYRELDSLRSSAIAQLPLRQRLVITLRDVEGWTSEEVCEVLEVRPTHQRVLLHRARVKVREAMQEFVERNQNR